MGITQSQCANLHACLPPLSIIEVAQIEHAFAMAQQSVDQAYCPRLGLCASVNGHFHQSVWTRDLFLASVYADQARLKQTIETILNHQHPNGSLPHRVELTRFVLTYFVSWMGRLGRFVTQRKTPKAIYEHSRGAVHARDTVPVLITMVANLYRQMDDRTKAVDFLTAHYGRLQKALTREERLHGDPDGLISSQSPQDWLDNLKRPGPLALINLLFLQAYRDMAFLAGEQRDGHYKTHCRGRARALRRSTRLFWNNGGYYQASGTDTRLDVPANVVACLYHHNASRAVQIQASIRHMVEAQGGLLATVSRRYPTSDLRWYFKLIGFTRYGHVWLYPWISQLNMLAKIRVARKVAGGQPTIAHKLLVEARRDFVALTKVHVQNDGFYEVLDPETLAPAHHTILQLPKLKLAGITVFQSGHGFLGSSATYCAVYEALRDLDLLESNHSSTLTKEVVLAPV